ncbi:hypothetical protein Taro_054751 [Colocasia esculenta]|uniref:Uncharacterized protein n=1 Tax=Colocasia esculenta TaxID=4460 RepID=A0A843XPA7_COLES|nr:hypothetical protein [Colocasia esculenta]
MEDVNKFCIRSLQIKLKEWRCELKKKGYMKGENEELSIEPPEQRITQATWDSLVDYWGTDEKVQEFERNKKNRAHEQATHTLGANPLHVIIKNNEKNWEIITRRLRHILRLIKQKAEIIPMSTLDLYAYEKVIEVCQEKDIMSSSEPTILSPILDVVCNGHHGGYERGCGLGWSKMSHCGDIGNQASNDNIKQLTVELQNAKAEIEAMHAREKEREEALQAREREREETMQARERERLEREEAMQARESGRCKQGWNAWKLC